MKFLPPPHANPGDPYWKRLRPFIWVTNQVAGMMISILELACFIGAFITSCRKMGQLAILTKKISDDNRQNPHRARPLPNQDLYGLLGVAAGRNFAGIVCSTILLCGITRNSIIMLRIWMFVRFFSIFVSISLLVATVMSPDYLDRSIADDSLMLISSLYFILVIWLYTEEAKEHNRIHGPMPTKGIRSLRLPTEVNPSSHDDQNQLKSMNGPGANPHSLTVIGCLQTMALLAANSSNGIGPSIMDPCVPERRFIWSMNGTSYPKL